MNWEYDYFEIDLSKVRVHNIQPDWTYNHHNTSRETIQGWIENLREIQQLCQSRGYSSADFEHLRQSPDPREVELAKSYDYFYSRDNWNSQRIKVEWVEDHYEVTEGRHRIWVAQEAGLTHVPALVAAPDIPTLERLRSDGERLFATKYPKRQEQISPWMRLQPEERNRLLNPIKTNHHKR